MPEQNLSDKMHSLLGPLIPGTLPDAASADKTPKKRTSRPVAKPSGNRSSPGMLWRFFNAGPFMTEAQVRALWRQRQLERSLGGPHEVQRLVNAAWMHAEPVGSVLVRHYEEHELDRLRRDVEDSAKYGWVAETLAAQPGHINVGRTALRVALGVGLMFGASRTRGTTTVKFTRVSDARSPRAPSVGGSQHSAGRGTSKRNRVPRVASLVAAHKRGSHRKLRRLCPACQDEAQKALQSGLEPAWVRSTRRNAGPP